MKNLIFLILIFIGCTPDDCPSFIIVDAEVTPLSSEYAIGDTISVVSRFDKTRVVGKQNVESTTESYYDVSNMPWLISLELHKINSPSQSFCIEDCFKLIEDEAYSIMIDSVSNVGEHRITAEFIETQDSLFIELKVIAERAGTYVLFLRDSSYNFELIDLGGRLITKGSELRADHRLDISRFSSGLHFCLITNEHGQLIGIHKVYIQ